MTAFSRTDISGEFGSLVVELKSVNHRFIEINFKIPDALKQLEVELRLSLIHISEPTRR